MEVFIEVAFMCFELGSGHFLVYVPHSGNYMAMFDILESFTSPPIKRLHQTYDGNAI